MPSQFAPDITVVSQAPDERLLQIIDRLVQETQSGQHPQPATLDSRLDRDLGLDSLGRTELLLRLEKAFQTTLPEDALTVETPRELLRLVQAADGAAPTLPAEPIRQAAPSAVPTTPAAAGTLLEVLNWHVEHQPERNYLYLFEADDQPETAVSYEKLYQGAQSVAAGLQAQGLEPKQTVAIMLPTGLDYFLSFFGILLAGGIPTPIYPPTRPSQLAEHLRRHQRILANAQTRVLITVPEAETVARLFKAQVADLRKVCTVAELQATDARQWRPPPVRSQDIAFLQYTSGSTGDPKGVMLTHDNLLTNIRVMGERLQVDASDTFISWLPLYHDMGLIGACLGSLYYAFPVVVMSPLSFMARPARWLWAIHRHGGTLSAAPNFAYELCLKHCGDAQLEGLDLSSWRIAMNGAEPVSPQTLERFIERFSHYGFRPEAMAPVYGLAESSLGVALPAPERGVLVDRIDRERFRRSGQAQPVAATTVDNLQFPACGRALAGHEIRIVDDDDRELPERQEGRLQFRGPSCTSGYYRNPDATRQLFHNDWLDSGDRAYQAAGEVYLTGRVKDLIIKGGRNFYPYELEQAVGILDGVRQGCVAVFASTAADGAERLVVAAEIRQNADTDDLQQQIRSAGVDLLGLPPDDILLVPPRTVLKTSSGKIRRTAMRELYERGTLGRGGGHWRTYLHLAGTGVQTAWRRLTRRAGALLYAGYAWTVYCVLAPFVGLAVLVMPTTTASWTVARYSAHLLRWLTGTPLRVQGLENLPETPCVVVANHASYLDSYVLAAVLPGRFGYVAKRELADNWVLKILLQRLGTVFVERFDVQRSADEGKQIALAVQAGKSLVFFPEGGFNRSPGLLPFRMGAFVAAAQAGVPVVPVIIRGTRSMLRPDSWFPRRGSLRVIMAEPIMPDGTDWTAAVRLRDAARAAILRQLDEPDMVQER